MHAPNPRLIAALTAAVLAGGLAACTNSTPTNPPATASPVAPASPAASATGVAVQPPSPTPTKAEKVIITADGYGAYQVKLALAKAKADGLLTKVQSSTGCPGWVTAAGTGAYADVVLVFYNGELLWLSVDKSGHETATGAQVGMQLTSVKAMYGSATELAGPAGAKALSVKSGANTIFFRFASTGTLESIEAGVAQTLEFRYTDGEGC